jgi:hypothetical protein
MDGVEDGADPTVDRTPGDAGAEELATRHHPVLARGEHRDHGVW